MPLVPDEIGNNTGQAKERVWFHAAPRQQASPLPEGYTMTPGHSGWSWVDLDEELDELSGLKETFVDPEAAAHA